MYDNLPAHLTVLSTLVPLSVAAGILFIIGRAYRDAGIDPRRTRRVLIATGTVIAAWLGIVAVLATNGFFQNFDTLPPRLLFAFAPGIVGAILFARSRAITDVAAAIPQQWAVGVQGFRIAMEAILIMGLIEGVVPRRMTFEGLNFDIVTGLTAPIVAYFCFVRRSWSPRVAVGFNIMGLAFLVIVAAIANLSAPTAFRVFMSEPSTAIVAHFPFTWTPAIVIPGALFFHLVSLRGLRARAALPKVQEAATARRTERAASMV
jgi:hypothetical protein